jgi:hypothetical protein
MRPSAINLAAALSNIVACERNHFLFCELIASREDRAIGRIRAARFDARAAFICAVGRALPALPPDEGMAMNAGLFHIQSTWLADIGGGFSDRPAKAAIRPFAARLFWPPVLVIAGIGVWMLLSRADNHVRSQPVAMADAATAPIQPVRLSDPNPALDASQFNSAVAPAESAPAEAAPLDGLKISSQSWRRGGLGSKALITLTLRNDNSYAVGDIGMLCSFSRDDGSPVTERRHTIHDTVGTKSRKTFARVHVGFINVTAAKAKCSLLSASRV